MSRSKLAALVAPLTAVALALSACGSGDSGGGGGVQAGDQATQGSWDINEVDVSKLKEGGELKWPLDSLPDNWNYNQLDGTLQDGDYIISAILPKLFKADKAGKVVINKDYLESAELTSTGPQVVTYKINPKAKWSDGTPFTWEDFDAQFKALNGTNTEFSVSGTTGYEDVEKVEKGASDQDVKVTFKRNFGEWTNLFTPLYPKSLNATPAEFNTGWQTAPKATAGPFKIGTIDPTAKLVTVVRDDAWWGDKPKLDKITYRVVERAALADSMTSGAIDWYTIGSSVDLYQRGKAIQGAVIRQGPGKAYSHLTFNGAPTSILSDPKLRIAVMKGLDPATYAKGILGPIVSDPKPLGNHFFLQGTGNYADNSAPVKADKEAAKTELDGLGWKLDGEFRKKDGKQLDIRLVSTAANPISEQISKLTQAQLKEIGINVVIDAQPSSVFFKDFVNTGNFDMVGFQWSQTPWPISSSKGIYYLDEKNVNQNYGRIGSEEINKKLDEANQELDEAKRVALTQDADKLIWAEGHHLPLYQTPAARTVRATLANFGSFGVADPDYTKIGFTG
ncbi:Oligopeptide ABC transporter, periplasmic oligopeptide-binding protein OppA [Actinokineospora spheciospongiae]|uniref:Oligopeptide ABC transporter, periplasmic oligopeptide-binding protein OppA n=1 Tax=Actinokineospora spheciospongiae TaxID=909613 RepID=W7IZ72_9PSEU|nr:ABC transporter family substrate-binding protein [Actinokineospora spheciospongiae]EWC59349.1 Oligopeptide ABC transporter, periplasmic oligopeptide-binding protein OppA [Actinokineospora spheciospongiae]